jgi:glutaconate CoA-transferase subunit A
MAQGRSKVVELHEAVAGFLRDGCHLTIGGFTVNRNPMAAVHEIIRQEVRDIHLYAHSNGQGVDELIGGGCVSRIEIAYGANGRFAPTCVRFRKAVEEGSIRCEDYTNYQMVLRFLAGAMGVPFLPARTSLGTDIVRKQGFDPELRKSESRIPDRKVALMDNPFGEWGDVSEVALVPAVYPDVTVLHVQRADERGNCLIQGLSFADVEQAKSAADVVVTCEELVTERELRGDPDRVDLPFLHVSAVSQVPFGAYPTACYGYYDYDPGYLREYLRDARDEERYRENRQRQVYGLGSHAELLELVGSERLESIRADPGTGYATGMDRV